MASTTRVNWTAEMKDTLISCIFQTHPNLVIDTIKVSEAWPVDKPRPTPRAITEQLGKMRKNGGGGKGFVRTRGARSAPVTPHKPKNPGSFNKNAGGSTGKRKRGSSIKGERIKDEEDQDNDDEEADDDYLSTIVRRSEVESLRRESGIFKRSTNGKGMTNGKGVNGFQNIDTVVGGQENNNHNVDSAVELDTPTKRLKVAEEVTRSPRPKRALKPKPSVTPDIDDMDEDDEMNDGFENQENEGGSDDSGSDYQDENEEMIL
ncbi:MAG: hypothetical protein M1823_004395 [Watsoniomyces obsoletus]|nr:MAG: hypothetical protein M1823_004395 [Watsoniomyces obsoletus]